MENFFSSKMKQKSDQALLQIIENENQYDKSAVLAAVLELEKRGMDIKERLPQDYIVNLNEEIIKDKEIEEKKFRFFSKNTIYILSVFLTPILIGPLLAYNIWESGNTKGALVALLSSIIYLISMIIIYNIFIDYDGLTLIMLLANTIGIISTIELLWKKYFVS